jgi:hypothetical protein
MPSRKVNPLWFQPPLTQTAAAKHAEVAKDSKSGKGQDRHLQGLYWTSLQCAERLHEWNLPSMFDSTYFETMSNKLSTSNVGGGFAGMSKEVGLASEKFQVSGFSVLVLSILKALE